VAWRGVELAHELAAGGSGRGEVLALFFELEAQVDGLLFEVGDLLAEGVGVGGGRGRCGPRMLRGRCRPR
jgi:hypothetical protein